MSMNVTVEEFISSRIAGKGAVPIEFYVELQGLPKGDGKPDGIEGWYNEEPYMYKDALVDNWRIEPSDMVSPWTGERFVTVRLIAHDSVED